MVGLFEVIVNWRTFCCLIRREAALRLISKGDNFASAKTGLHTHALRGRRPQAGRLPGLVILLIQRFCLIM